MSIDLALENERLRAKNAALRERVAELEEVVAQLKAELEGLKGQLEEAERAGKRQAAPFSKGPPQANPKRSGRPAGHAPAHRRRPEWVDRTLGAELPGECPDCGGELTNHRVEEQFVIDIPPVEPLVTQFNVHIADCVDCGKRVQGRHAEQISDEAFAEARLSEEPGVGKPHAGIRGGDAGKPAFLPRWRANLSREEFFNGY